MPRSRPWTNYTYGAVTSLGGAGLYEFVTVQGIDAGTNTIWFEGCSTLAAVNSYSTAGNFQVIRVPQYTTLTVQSGASVVPDPWDGATGGVLALFVADTLTIDAGGALDASERGFRGGLSVNSGTINGSTQYTTANPDIGAAKGEGIGGQVADLGRGAPANGGGGGASHNAAGGGGANGDNGNGWDINGVRGGQGVMPAQGPEGFGGTPPYVWTAAWALDPAYADNGNALTDSAGGGRGGYTFGGNNADELTLPPGNSGWGGDNRREVGGLGGRPVANNPATRLYLGGGGGAGHMNNKNSNTSSPSWDPTNGNGGDGGGLVFVIANSVEGAGEIRSNGAIGRPSQDNNPNDAPGGGGAGGTIVIKADAIASSLSLLAEGGRGGIQPYTRTSNESEGGGGGGGGGYIAISAGTPTRSAAGGLYGYSTSQSVDNFQPNGATSGAEGQATETVTNMRFCKAWTVGVVFDDLDGDGIQGPGEPGIPGVTVTITTPDGPVDVTTDANGVYALAFNPGAVSTSVDENDPVLGGSPISTTGNNEDQASPGNLGAGEGFVADPVGYTRPGTLSGLVFNDADRDGTPDPGEDGFSNVTVTLTYYGPDGVPGGGDDVVFPAVDTGPDGSYSFANLAPGNYEISVDTGDLPVGVTTLTAGTNPRTFSIGPNGVVTEDFGYEGSVLSIQKTSDASGPVAPGDTITYTIEVTNEGGGALTDVAITDTLPAGLAYVANSVSLLVPGGGTQTFGDDMESGGYAGSTGTSPLWTGPWTEINDDGDPASGDVRNVTDNAPDNELRLERAGRAIQRTANLAGAQNVELSFTWRHSNQWDTDDEWQLQVATAPAGPFTTIEVFTGTDPQTDQLHVETTDLVPFIGAQTTIRFVVVAGGPVERLYIDDVEWSFTVSGAGTAGPPPNLASDIELGPGETATVTFQATVDDPLAPGIDEITNTATASATGATSIQGGVSDPVGGTITGHLFNDANGNGVQDPGEADLANVDVILTLNGGGTLTVTTDGNGDYTATVPAGSTTATVDASDPDLPLGATLTTGNATQTVNVPGGGSIATDDVGYQVTGTFSAVVFRDLNQNGVRDPGEPLLPNITVAITLNDGDNTVVFLSTDGNGVITAVVPAGTTGSDVDENDPNINPAPAIVTTGNDPQTTNVPAGSFVVAPAFGLFFENPLLAVLEFVDASVDPETDLVTVIWRTTLEESNAGFHVWRVNGLGQPTQLTSTIIPGLGDSMVGADYSWTDPEPYTNSVPRYYYVVDIDFAGKETWHGPAVVAPTVETSVEDWLLFH